MHAVSGGFTGHEALSEIKFESTSVSEMDPQVDKKAMAE